MATDQIFAKNEKLTEIVNIKTRRLEDLKVREREKISLELLFNILTKNDSRAFQFICTFPLNFFCKIFWPKMNQETEVRESVPEEQLLASELAETVIA